MKFVCLSDYHGATEIIPRLPKMIQAEEPDMIFYCGGSMKGEKRLVEYETARKFHSKPDVTGRPIQDEILKDMEHLQQFLQVLSDTQKIAYVLPGYTDAPEDAYFKLAYNYAHIYSNLRPAHEMMYREEAFMVAGFGGGITNSEDNRELVLQYSRTWVEFALRRLEYFPGEKILLFNSPPVCRLDQSEDEHCGVLIINEII